MATPSKDLASTPELWILSFKETVSVIIFFESRRKNILKLQIPRKDYSRTKLKTSDGSAELIGSGPVSLDVCQAISLQS
jgi:hypothetical protein